MTVAVVANQQHHFPHNIIMNMMKTLFDNMESVLKVKFDFKRRLSSRERTTNVEKESPQTVSSSTATMSRRKMKTSNPAKYKEYLMRDTKRKTKYYHNIVKIRQTSSKLNREEARKKWAKQKQELRKRNKETSLTQSTKVKRFTDMTPNEKKEYMREKKKESRCKLSRQKKAILQTKQNNQRHKARTTARNNTDDDQNHGTADMTSSMSRATIYRKNSAVRSNIPKSPKAFLLSFRH